MFRNQLVLHLPTESRCDNRLDIPGRARRYANFGRTPLFAATVAATMGLALGLVGAAFTLLNAYLVRPVNLPNPRALYILSWDTETTRDERFGLADYQALAPEAGGLAGAAATLDVAVMQDAVSTRGLRLASAAAVLDFGARPFVVGATTVFVATTVAALLPLLGTTRIDPAQALRTE